MIIAKTDRLVIRNWRETDRDLAYEINSDEAVMEFYPFRRNRAEADAFFDRVRSMIAETGLGLYVLELKESGEAIGYCGLMRTDHLEPFVPAGTIEIGWRLVARQWGKGLVTKRRGHCWPMASESSASIKSFPSPCTTTSDRPR